MALRALLLSTEKGAADVRGTVEVTLNGKTVETLALTPENNDLLHQFVFKGIDAQSANSVELRFDGKGGLAYQVVGRYFIPWDGEACERAALDRRGVRPRAPGAGRYCHGHGDGAEQPAEDGQHGDGGPGDSAGVRSAERRFADAPGEDARAEERAAWRSSA